MIKIVTKNNKIINRLEFSDIEKVRKMREQLGYSFSKIGKEIGCNTAYICDFYNHKVRK